MNTRLVDLIREKFEKTISQKTGWGKNEIMRAFNQAVSEATLHILDELEQGRNDDAIPGQEISDYLR